MRKYVIRFLSGEVKEFYVEMVRIKQLEGVKYKYVVRFLSGEKTEYYFDLKDEFSLEDFIEKKYWTYFALGLAEMEYYEDEVLLLVLDPKERQWVQV